MSTVNRPPELARLNGSPEKAQREQPVAPELVSLGSLIQPALDRAERRRRGEDKPVPVAFLDWAEALGGGFWPGAHFLISGTGVGKSQGMIQNALAAAKEGIGVAYVGLELDEMQIALRVLGEHVGLGWSKLYLGRCSDADMDRARQGMAALEGLPFFADFGQARGWPASRLTALAEQMRAKQPEGPLLIVLDYLQLVGDEPNEGNGRTDLRERIGGAAYAARDVARRYDVAVVMISSAARNHYGLLAGDFSTAGLTVRSGRRVITHPHVLTGLGKESGELEFSADTSTVMLRWPAQLDNGETAIIVATPKVRAGAPSWSAMAFNGTRFAPFAVQSLDDLPPPPKRTRAGGKDPVGDDELERRVLTEARRNPSLPSRNRLALATKGNRSDVLATIDRLVGDGRIAFSKTGVVVPADHQEENA